MGVTLGIVQILWQIYMLTLFIKDSLPGKQTRAFHSLLHPLLFFLLILFRSYYHPPFLRVYVGGRGSFLSLGNQPRVDSWRRTVLVSLWCSGASLLSVPGAGGSPLARVKQLTQDRGLNVVPGSTSSGCRALTAWFLHLWAKAWGVLFSVCWSSLGLECVPRQTFFHWNELAQSWAGKSNPLGLRLHAWLDFPPPPLSRCLGEATKA